ncbi:MAG: extracellular solute-binding protein [Armatimonadota bacterium]|nr:extracellular solute-binding protein [Armatimonadota bacterium]
MRRNKNSNSFLAPHHKLFVLVMAVSFLLIFPAHAANQESKKKEKVTIQFTGLYVSESSPKIEWRANNVLVKKFFQEHEYIKMKKLTDLKLPGEMNIQGADMTMSMVGDAAPDIFWLQSEDFAKSVDQGFLMPLDDYVKNWPEAKTRLSGAVLDLCSAIGPDGKKHVYALPFGVAASCLTYSRKRFREVGLVDGRGRTLEPRDWDEVWEFSKKVYDADIDPVTKYPKRWAIQLPLEGWFFDTLPAYAGGTLWKKNPDGTWDTTVNSKAAVRSLDFIKKLCWGEWTDGKGRRIKGVMQMKLMAKQEGGNSGGPKSTLSIEGIDLQEAGIVAMSLGSLYTNFNERMYKDPQKYGLCRFPKYPGPEGKYANRIGGTLIAIKSTIKDKRVADACWEFISYLCGEQGEREKTKIFVDNGVARYVNPDLLRKYGYPEEIVSQVPDDWARAYRQVFKDAYATEDPPGLSSIATELAGPCRQLIRNPKQDSKIALDDVQKIVERSYLYTPTEKEMAFNRKIALFVVILLAAAMATGGVLILRVQIRENLAQERERVYVAKVPKSKQILAWALMTPAILSVFLWQYVPVAWGSIMAFQNVHILGGSDWAGLDNFIRVAIRPLFWLAWKNTIIYVFMVLAMAFAAPIILALLLSEIPKGKTLFRTLYYLPALTTGVVTTLLWMQFYDPTEFGLMNRVVTGIHTHFLAYINHFIAFLHIPLQIPKPPTLQWLLDPRLAMAATILPTIWAGMGPGCIIYIAALKAVPEEMYDAADLDGAGILQKSWHVTMPVIFPLILINFVGAFIGAFHSSGNILIMTGGGPNHATHVIGLEIFRQGYVLANYGQTTAIAWMLASLLIGFAVFQMKIFARMKFSTAEQQGQ